MSEGKGGQPDATVLSDLIADLHVAATFFTRLPLAAPAVLPPGRLAATAWSIPLIGMAVGLAAGLVFWLGTVIGVPATLAPIPAIAAQVWLTGALHEEGLGDFADGMGAGGTREERIAVMRDSQTGSYGVVALVLALAARLAALAVIAEPAVVVGALVASGAMSRTALVWIMTLIEPAQPARLSGHAGQPRLSRAVVASLIAAVPMLWLGVGPALIALSASGAGAAVVGGLAQHRLQGQTGDVLGAGQQAAEVLGLIALAALLASAA